MNTHQHPLAAAPISATASWTPERWDEFHQGLEHLLAEHGAGLNRNDQARLLIAACVSEGINTVPKIITAVAPIGFNPRHLGVLMNNDQDGWWRRADRGVLRSTSN